MFSSMVVPCYNEEAVLPELHRRLVLVLEQVAGIGFELIYADVGSSDDRSEISSWVESNSSHCVLWANTLDAFPEVKLRPLYVVRERPGFTSVNDESVVAATELCAIEPGANQV